MNRELLLLRHGKAAMDGSTDDFHRPLKDGGKRGAQRVGVRLAQGGWVPDLIITSPAVRARVTAEKCCKAGGIDLQRLRHDERLYLANVDTLLAVLADCPAEVCRVMLVGHNSGLERLLEYIGGDSVVIPADGELMPTATLARVLFDSDWYALQKGQGQLQQLIRASDLPKRFPFPLPNSEELRDRPAYYYTQSSVIPYRIDHGRVQILIVRSSKGKHWVVPKGIADPGMSLEASACKEAWEEAGIEGEIDGDLLGTYSYVKWGSDCTVSVFPLRVTRQLPDREWEESHRGRQWVSIDEAAALLKQKALHAMVRLLEERVMKCQD